MELLDTSIANVFPALHCRGAGPLVRRSDVDIDHVTWWRMPWCCPCRPGCRGCWAARIITWPALRCSRSHRSSAGSLPALASLLLARVLQGIGGGGLAPVEQAILVDTFPPHKRASAFCALYRGDCDGAGHWPVLGGWITDNYNWRWVFLINIPIGILSMFLTSRFVHDTPAFQEERKTVSRTGWEAARGWRGHCADRPRLGST